MEITISHDGCYFTGQKLNPECNLTIFEKYFYPKGVFPSSSHWDSNCLNCLLFVVIIWYFGSVEDESNIGLCSYYASDEWWIVVIWSALPLFGYLMKLKYGKYCSTSSYSWNVSFYSRCYVMFITPRFHNFSRANPKNRTVKLKFI